MALHHPIRLAVQTSLLDNLSRGRLIVGIGRGSAYNEFEYIGFGTTMDEGRQRLAEAEDLLVKAWTGENIEHQGKHWQSVPAPAAAALSKASSTPGACLHRRSVHA